MRPALRRDPYRADRRRRALRQRRALRTNRWGRADPRLIGATRPSPTRSRRQPPAQPRTTHHRHHPRPPGPRDARLPGPQGSRGQDAYGGHAVPQAPPRPQVLPAAQRTIKTTSPTGRGWWARGSPGILIDRSSGRCSSSGARAVRGLARPHLARSRRLIGAGRDNPYPAETAASWTPACGLRSSGPALGSSPSW